MQLFYDEEFDLKKNTHLISADESNHILRVLRKSIGDTIHLTNGKGVCAQVEIVGVKSKRCEVFIVNSFREDPIGYHLHIGIAPPKSSDRFEFFLEKATEMGISQITPLLCYNSERKRINQKRSLKILQSAMKQSNRLFLPQLNEMISIDQFLSSDHGEAKTLIAHCEADNKTPLKNELNSANEYCCLIGPEGDFSTDEINFALKNGFEPISLGEKRLRTETAALYLCQALAFKFS